MKFLFVLLLFSAAVILHGSDFKINIVNNSSGVISGFPVVSRIGEIGAEGDFNAVTVKDHSGKTLAGQFDDLDNDGKAGKDDEIAFPADLHPGNNVFTVSFSRQAPAVSGAVKDKALELSAENRSVKVSVHRQKPLLRRFFCLKDGKWQCVAGAFVLEPRMDNSWKWKNSSFRVNVVSAGKVRSVIRCELVKKGTDNGKTVRIINDLSVFNGRNEILSKFIFVNDSANQLVQINTVNTGMYQVLAEGKTPAGTIRFAGTLQNGRISEGTVDSGSFLLRRPAAGQDIWLDTFAAAYGFGVVLADHAKVDNLLARYIAKSRSLRVSALFRLENSVLWPGKSAEFDMWMIPYAGTPGAVKDFSGNIRNIKVEYSK